MPAEEIAIPSVRRPAAGIVVFGAEPEQLTHLVETLAPSVDRLYVFINGLIDASLRTAIAGVRPVQLMESDYNLGVGAALNFLALAALLDGFDHLLVFDQDTRARPGLVEALGDAFDRLHAAGEHPAILAPRLVAGERAAKAPTYVARQDTRPLPGLRPVAFLPTSGSLLDLAALRRIGFFRADYFIDAIDLEASFRAWAGGYSCWLAEDLALEHAVGAGVIEWRLVGLRMPAQKPFRMYCYLRNTIYGLRLGHIPSSWKLRQAAYLMAQTLLYAAHHRFRPAVLRQLACGFYDGIRGKLGPPADAPLAGGRVQRR